MKKLTRAYKLPLYHNPSKGEVVRYTAKEYSHFLKYYIGLYVFQGLNIKPPSTKGLGWIANQALHAAKGKAEGLLELQKLGNKINIPSFDKLICPAKIQENKKTSTFSHWVVVSGAHRTTTYLPTRLTKPVKNKLSKGWSLSDHVEIHKDYALVFVTKEKQKLEIPTGEVLGADVGWNHGVTRSDGYIGRKLKPIALKEQKAQKERSRQGHLVKKGNWRQIQAELALVTNWLTNGVGKAFILNAFHVVMKNMQMLMPAEMLPRREREF